MHCKLIELGKEVWGYIFSALVLFLFIIDIVSVFFEDRFAPDKPTEPPKLRAAWWRNANALVCQLLVQG